MYDFYCSIIFYLFLVFPKNYSVSTESIKSHLLFPVITQNIFQVFFINCSQDRPLSLPNLDFNTPIFHEDGYLIFVQMIIFISNLIML